MQLYCDSQATLHVARDLVFLCNFVREKLDAGILVLTHIRAKNQPADIFTKAVVKGQFQFLKGKLGILDLHAPT